MKYQELIFALQKFWADKGCILAEPYDIEKGAGTMNPFTFLRVLGPEPWNVAYTEPSRRPADGRYGDNPNRLYQHHQLQLIMKPSPDNIQELYLESLAAIGIEAAKHDIRFVEDNWESPTLGAWGLGWEVWLDGMEITQFTYFQQVGSQDVKPVAVEITYGLERLAMYIQGVENVYDVEWADGVTYGDVFHQNEFEQTSYAFDLSDEDLLFELFDKYEAEAVRVIKLGYVHPAYDYVLKCSHTFNLLDARGAISVSERTAFIGRVRKLARMCAEVYLQQREKLGYPLLKRVRAQGQGVAVKNSVPNYSSLVPSPSSLLLEIGTEEIPAHAMPAILDQLKTLAEKALVDARIAFGKIQTLGTPRRLALIVDDVAPRQADITDEKRGASAKIAFDADGKPTKAAIGFANKNKVRPEDLIVRDGYIYAVIREQGKPSAEIFQTLLPKIICDLSFPNNMRWGSLDFKFIRPLRWIVALFGAEIIPFEVANVQSGRTSRGHRFLSAEDFDIISSEGDAVAVEMRRDLDAANPLPDEQYVLRNDFERDDTHEPQNAVLSPLTDTACSEVRRGEFVIKTADDYVAACEKNFVIVDQNRRREMIAAQINDVAKSKGGVAEITDDLLEEVLYLVEYPTALVGSFEEKYLQLPAEAVITPMRDHQRYFPVKTADGALMPLFITIRNGGEEYLDIVQHGNERVLKARLEDAQFFFNEDRKKSLAEHRDKLKTVVFQEGLGSVYEKTERLTKLVEKISDMLGVNAETRENSIRAAQLSKADLVTGMVTEFTELQGVMGREYAKLDGEVPEVCAAIDEHYMPRFAGDAQPKTIAGKILSIADKIDNIVATFSRGLVPTGSQDPFALRRQALGIVNQLTGARWSLPLSEVVEVAMTLLNITDAVGREKIQHDFADFMRLRVKNVLSDSARYDVIDAVLDDADDVFAVTLKATAVEQFLAMPDSTKNIQSFVRVSNLAKKAETAEFDAGLFATDAEKVLHGAFAAIKVAADELISKRDFLGALDVLKRLSTPIDSFFDSVMVMDEDLAVRANRLALLKSIDNLLAKIADFGKIVR